jgi:ABC-type transporter Mla maintaining outer membrane lipid asymmetry permease subunit MlaE
VFNIIAPRIVGGRVSVLLLLRILVVYPVSIAGCILWQRLWAGVKQSCLKRN